MSRPPARVLRSGLPRSPLARRPVVERPASKRAPFCSAGTYSRSCVWCWPEGGGRLRVATVDTSGRYTDSRLLSAGEPWHEVATAMLEVGGQAVEIPANEADVHLAERIRDEGALLSGNASIWRPTWESEGVQWNCMGNALRLREVEPGHTFNLWIGEGLHDVPGIGPAWELHTAAVDETGQLWEATSQPAAYCGFAVSDYDYWFWAFAVGGDTAFAGFLI